MRLPRWGGFKNTSAHLLINKPPNFHGVAASKYDKTVFRELGVDVNGDAEHASTEYPWFPGPAESSGATVDQRLKSLMKELGEAINESLSDSDQIAEVISRIKSDGYDVFLVLEATIGFNRHDDEDGEESKVGNAQRLPADFSVTAQDVKFLKSLRISVDDDD
jgi:hypothetical protein